MLRTLFDFEIGVKHRQRERLLTAERERLARGIRVVDRPEAHATYGARIDATCGLMPNPCADCCGGG